MSENFESADRPLLDLIRRRGPLSVADLTNLLGVTPTAVRHRLSRLVESGLVARTSVSVGRGRPKHLYQASTTAQKRLGQNYTDLALVLWGEMMSTISDRKLRRMLFSRITDRLAELYREQVRGEGWEHRLIQLGAILHDRGIEAEVVHRDGDALPLLKQHSCPYYELAEVDDAICALERKMFEKVLGRGLRLSQCRLEGHRSRDFEAKPILTTPA
ncbi:MAG: MarR family transcriptional regulator [Isosphaeraceae bacterium]